MGAPLRLCQICLLCLFFFGVEAQIKVESSNDNWREEVERMLGDSLNPQNLSWRLQEAGFWMYRRDSTRIITGPKLNIGELKWAEGENSSMQVLNDSNYRFILGSELIKWGNAGYPFAAFSLKNQVIRDQRLEAELELIQGPFIRFDSLIIKSPDPINRKFIEQEIGWKKGQAFSTDFLEKLQQNIARREFLQLERAPAIAFFAGKAHIFLYLRKRNANLINGVIGLNTDDAGNSTLTGDFQLRLLNIFQRGELIDLRWRSPGQQSQDLNLGLAYPYLGGSPLGISFHLNVFRQDSSFLRRDFKLGLPYRLAPGAHFKLSGEYFSTNPIGLETQSTLLLSTIETFRLQLGFDLDRRDNAIVSRQGYFLAMELGSGQRNGSNGQYLWNLDWRYFQPLGKRWVWHQKYLSKGMTGDELQDNEVFRLGGLNSLRGFNEWSFFTPAFGLMRSEIRYMLGPFDYITAFADLALNEVDREASSAWDRHSGIGLGLNFQTKGGLFSLFLAAGQSNAANYDLRNGKIHLAYVNRF